MFFFFFFNIELKVATKKKERKNHARCNKMCRPLPPTKILHCPQCIKAKINSSIKGRSYFKHLNFFFFFLKFLSHLQMLAHKIIIIIIIIIIITKQKNKNKNKRQNEKRKKKNRKKRKLKQIWYNFIRFF